MFWLAFGILISTGIFYFIFADGKIQAWNDPKTRRSYTNGVENGHVHKSDESSHELKDNFIKNF